MKPGPDDIPFPENVPLKDYIKSFKMMVVVYNLETELVEREIEVDYGDADDRKWLGRVSFWACTNKRSVETMSLEDWESSK